MSAINLTAAAQAYGYNQNNNEIDDQDEHGGFGSRSAKIGERVTFLTRALVKNNIVGQTVYLVLLSIEYLCMVYYILRLADHESLYTAFKFVEDFLDVGSINGVSFMKVSAIQSGQISIANATMSNGDIAQQVDDIAK